MVAGAFKQFRATAILTLGEARQINRYQIYFTAVECYSTYWTVVDQKCLHSNQICTVILTLASNMQILYYTQTQSKVIHLLQRFTQPSANAA